MPVKAYAMKALESQAGSAEGGASPWRSFSVGYFLNLVQVICVQSFYLLIEMLLDSVEDIHAVLAVNHVYCQAPLAKAACAPNAVQVGLIVWVPVLVHRKVKIDDHRHLFNINTCTKGGRQETRGRGTISHTYPVALETWLGQVTCGMWPLKSTH